MDVEGFLESLRRDPAYADQIVYERTEPVRPPEWGEIPEGLHADVGRFLASLGVPRLYCHQADAIEAALRGEDVLITTGPASGKSVCYQAPILQSIIENPDATALLVFPAKALARDQVASWDTGLGAIADSLDPRENAAMPFDADADAADRRLARNTGRLLVTNPEMLHVNLLPGHGRWSRFFRGLKYVVLDEVHTYAGFFGSNMANVVRRLQRVAEHHGSRPQFICSSATVGNPREVVERITGRGLHHVARDASATGSRTYVFWNPPRIKRRRWRGRRSANVEAHELMVKLIQTRVPTICFSKARTTAELVYRYVRETLEKEAPGLADRVIPYRGGYSAKERREMERRLREGEVLGVSATRALELGIDIGALDACIVIGYPGVLNAFYQQMGRAGRAGRDSLCILVGTDTPINQHIMAHPEYVFERPVERAVVDSENPFVVLGHVSCAAAELPVRELDLGRFGYATKLALEVLEEKHKVRRTGNAWYHSSSERPSHDVRLRGYGDESTVVMDVDTEQVIDKLDKFRALRIFYPGAIYFHLGDTYEMVHHDFDRNLVTVRRKDVSYYTDPSTGTAVDHVDAILDQRPLGTGTAFLGEVFAVLSTPVYEKIGFYSMERISQHPTDVPPASCEAMSFWLETPEELPGQVARLGLNPESGMSGILFCTSRILPLFLTSDANDFDWSVGCRNVPWHTMFWYEFYLHGIGNSEQCYERFEEILAVTLDHLLTCDCDDGCPNCTSRLITPYHVRNIELGEGDVKSRRAAVVVLNSVLTGQSAEESLALLEAPRENRGQRFLPTVTMEPEQREPHRMPLNDRTRGLMVRKLDRSLRPKQPVDHAIDFQPKVGVPPKDEKRPTEPVEPVEPSVPAEEKKQRSKRDIRQKGSALSRRLSRELGALSKGAAKPSREEEEPTPAQSVPSSLQPIGDPEPGSLPRGRESDLPLVSPRPAEAESTGGAVIQAGDDLARRARKLKRKRT